MKPDKKNRIYGIHAIEEALDSGETPEKVFLLKGSQNPGLKEIEHKLHKLKIPVSYVPIQKLNKLTSGNHQGIVANIAPVTYRTLEEIIPEISEKETPPLVVLLDGVTDVRNLGAIIRTAECCGVDAIILPKQGAAPIDNYTVKTSAGAVFKLPICRVDHPKDALFFLQGYGFQMVAATEKSNKLVYDADLKKPTVLIMGDEGKGISSSLLKLVDEKVKLPQLGEISSLNVSVACGIFLYEAVRQRM